MSAPAWTFDFGTTLEGVAELAVHGPAGARLGSCVGGMEDCGLLFQSRRSATETERGVVRF